jgi:competence protein ComFB
MELKNQMEIYVLETMDSVLEKYPDCCKCEHCRQDIAVIALNHLPPKYVATQQGCVFAKIDAMTLETKIEIVEQIAKAVEIVSKNPHHG